MTANLLADSTSPYLLQHKDNPVHWRPWGPDALAAARAGDRPILLSVGYAACHWCHVMAHESFENPDIAALMNELFVNVKVDREERPDIDAIYMAALHMLGEQGGWPMTMFLTPDGEPFWGGTYFPPEPRWGRPSFPAVCREIARLYADERAMVDSNRAALRGRLATLAAPEPGDLLTAADAHGAAEALLGAMDPVNGGLRGAPKFPNCGVFELMLRAGVRRSDPHLTEAVTFALERICQGGIYDHLGGGFARYAVDSRWLVPHFEKMLYDNAQLLDVLTTAWQLTRKPLFAARIAETVAWAARDMRLDGGGFASSLDADSEGEEGRYYVWTLDEITELLGSDATAFCEAYDVTADGNWEGRAILNRLAPDAIFSLTADQRLRPLREQLLAARAARVPPGLDDKVLADWNGLMIAALARAATVFDRPDWLELATGAFRFVTDSMTAGDQLRHAWRAGAANITGLASDYANMAAAAAALHEVTGEPGYRDRAAAWLAILDSHFTAESGGYHMSPASASDLIVRPLAAADEATPNPNAVALETRIRLNCFTGNNDDAELARLLAAFAPAARAQPFSHARLLAAAAMAQAAMEIVVCGPAADTAELWRAAWRTAAPAATRMRMTGAAGLPDHHLVRASVTDRASAHVCTNRTCSPPLTDPARLTEEIETRRTA